MFPKLERYLKESLPRERWFASKSAEIKDVQIEDHSIANIAGKSFLFCSARVNFAESSDRYMIYLSGDAKDPATCKNALEDRDFANYFYDIFQRSGTQATDSGNFSGENLEPSNAPNKEFDSTYLLQLEQSNSSVVLGSEVIMKIYRRKTDFLTPDYQVPKALLQQTDYTGTPPLLGSISYSRGGDASLLATIFRFIKNEGDCWTLFINALKQNASTRNLDGKTLSEEVSALGRATAELHNALASLRGDHFTPTPVDDRDFSAWLKEFENAASIFSKHSREFENVPEYEKMMERARKLLTSFLDERIVKTRIHGDYHLGQVLKNGGTYYIIDFEGEPMRTLEYRRHRQSPVKDVAGMLRSLNYAALSCMLESSDQEVSKRCREWAAASSKMFVDSYLRSVNLELDYVPAKRSVFRKLLDFFVLEKALYEFNYEINNRPSWVKFPLNAIIEIMQVSK